MHYEFLKGAFTHLNLSGLRARGKWDKLMGLSQVGSTLRGKGKNDPINSTQQGG